MGEALKTPVCDPVFDREQSRWLSGQLGRLDGLRDLMASRHRWRERRDGLAVANDELRRVVESLRLADLQLDWHDDEIKKFAERKAEQCEKFVINRTGDLSPVERILEVYGLELPAGGRYACPLWWRQQIRKLSGRACEALCRDLGYTHKGGGAYVAEYTLRRWVAQQRRNAATLEAVEAENDAGECFTLAELAAVSVSNPEMRRNELMTRLRGFEEWAEQDGREWDAMFYTVTAPSKYHARIHNGRPNPKYNGATPKECAQYLQTIWQRIRARLDKLGVQYFGFRIAEPHHDGTPHWHLLLWVAPIDKWALTEVLAGYALAEDGDEPGAQRARFEAVQLEGAGGAAGYVAKYVSKNIDGFGVGEDYEAGDFADVTAARVRAWASVWGIRQFQQIAGPGVTVWRELRRVARNPERAESSPEMAAIMEPADDGNWLGYMLAMGGALMRRKDRPARILYSENKLEADATGRRQESPAVGRYGEAVKRVFGVIGDSFLAVSRWRIWTVRQGVRESTGRAMAGARDLCREIKTAVTPPAWQFGPGVGTARGLWSLRERLRRECGFYRTPQGGRLDLCQ